MTEEQARCLQAFYSAGNRYKVVRAGASTLPGRDGTELLNHYRGELVNAFVAAVQAGAINGGANGLVALLAASE